MIDSTLIGLVVERKNRVKHWEKLVTVKYGDFEIMEIRPKGYIELILDCVLNRSV